MSRFHRFEIYGWRLELRPIGWRGLPLLRYLPNRTGDEIAFHIKARQVGHTCLEDKSRFVTLQLHSVRDLSEIIATAQRTFGDLIEQDVFLGRVSFSGEYWVDVSYARKNERGDWSHQRGLGVAVIQVKEDYLVWTTVISIITGLLGVIGTLLAQWLT